MYIIVLIINFRNIKEIFQLRGQSIHVYVVNFIIILSKKWRLDWTHINLFNVNRRIFTVLTKLI